MTDVDAARAAALRDLRAAEAARVLGLLDPSTLPPRARSWVAQGLATPAALALAAGPGGPASSSPMVLLATLAAEYEVAIHDLGQARAVHAEAVIGLAGQGGDFAGALFDLSNSVTDGITARARRWWRGRRPD